MMNSPESVTSSLTQPALPPRSGFCATCGEETVFVFLGEQRWPAAVAASAGVSPVVHLWTCQACQTTLVETFPQ